MTMPLVETPTYLLDGLLLNATDTTTSVDWIVTDEQGWSSAAPVRLSTAARENADGGVSGPVWRDARLINLKGIAIAPNRYSMLMAKEQLRGVAASSSSAYALTVAEAHLTRVVFVKHFAEARIRDRGAFAFEWELSLRADDPYRYAAEPESVQMSLPTTPAGGWVFASPGPTTVFPLTLGAGLVGGSKVVHNPGNAPTFPLLIIAGPLTNPMVENASTGRRISLTLNVTVGEQLVIDMGGRTATVNGANRFDALTLESSWWALEPGYNEIRFSAATGDTTSPLLTVTHRPAWR